MDEKHMKLIALADQAWANTADRFQDIERIAGGGITPTDADSDLVRAVFNTVAGEIVKRAIEADGGA